jgi:hypothetical protein
VIQYPISLKKIEMKNWTESLKEQKSIDQWLKFLSYGQELYGGKLPEE